MSGYALHPEAYRDLDEIWEFIALDNINAADHLRKIFTPPSVAWYRSPQPSHYGRNS
jgi:hypothetical protein